jgi:hypothetical protein
MALVGFDDPANADQDDESDKLVNDNEDQEIAEVQRAAQVDETADASDDEMAEFQDEGEHCYHDKEVEDN